MVKRTKCECGGKLVRLLYRHVQDVAGQSVEDSSAFARQCEACGDALVSMKQLAKYERRAAALVLREGSVNGGVVKFARKALGMTQADLGAAICCRPETVSRWETGVEKIPRASQLAIVALLDGGPPDVAPKVRRTA